jgi:hypothetical protein
MESKLINVSSFISQRHWHTITLNCHADPYMVTAWHVSRRPVFSEPCTGGTCCFYATDDYW